MRHLLLALIGLLGLLLVGCAGGDDEVGGQPTAALSPVATPAGAAAELPCEVPADIESYRFTVGMKMDIPGLEEALEELEGLEGFEGTIPTGEPEGEEDGFEELGEAFAGLLGVMLGGLTDMSVEGAFVAPDRTEVQMKFGDLQLKGIIIGDRQWTKLGGMDWEESTGEGEGWTVTTDLSDLCEGFGLSLPEVAGLEGREETKNGVDTLHYHLDETDFTRFADFFGGDGDELAEVQELLEEGTLDLWLAKDGNWPVRIEVEGRGQDEELGDISLSIFMEVKDLNDSDIKIEPPVPTLSRAGERPSRLVWRFETGGPVESSPTAVGGLLYVGSDDSYVYALDAATGEERWRFETGGQVRSSPTVAEGVLYVGSHDGNVYALDAATGEERWRFQTTGPQVSSSPAVVDGVVYVGSQDRYVFALDAATGEEHWRFEAGDILYSSPEVVNGVVYLGSHIAGGDGGRVYALEAATGEERWRFEMDDEVWSSPAAVDGIVYIGSRDDCLYALDAATGEARWRFDTGGRVDSSPAVVGEVVYIGSGIGSGRVYALEAATGSKLWSFKAGISVDSSPTVVGGVVYIGSQDTHVYALDAATGEERWRFKTGGIMLWSSPAVVDGVVYIGSNDGYVYAITEG